MHFLQIWLEPNRIGVEPGYEQKHFSESDRRGQLRPLVSPDGRDGSIRSSQDAVLYGTLLESGESVALELGETRAGYVHVARGVAMVNGQRLVGGDGASIGGESGIRIEGIETAEVLVFDLPPAQDLSRRR